jgi:hypothetical protein
MTEENGGEEKGGDPWRDHRGRFLPGNPGGPGNPHVRELARLRALWREMTPDVVFESLQGALLGKALAGHFPALKLYLEYMMGKPDKGVDVDELDVHELLLEARRRGAERAARWADVELVPALPPEPAPAPWPPPAGRPEAEWRRVRPPAAEAAPPPGAARGVGLTAAGLRALHRAGQSVEQLRELCEAHGWRGESPPDAGCQPATVYKREQRGSAGEGAPAGHTADDRR